MKNKKEFFELAIKKGYTYNPETGNCFGPSGSKLEGKQKIGYSVFNVYDGTKQVLIYAHQFAWYYVNKEIAECIDHINQVKDDNRIENLRSVTRLQNQWNQKERKGYTRNKRDNNWTAQIQIQGRRQFLGNFKTEEEAKAKYEEAKVKLRASILEKNNGNEIANEYKPIYKGYTKVKGKELFEVSITVKGKRFRSFHKTEDEAKEAYKKLKEININT